MILVAQRLPPPETEEADAQHSAPLEEEEGHLDDELRASALRVMLHRSTIAPTESALSGTLHYQERLARARQHNAAKMQPELRSKYQERMARARQHNAANGRSLVPLTPPAPPRVEAPSEWACATCTLLNDVSRDTCVACGSCAPARCGVPLERRLVLPSAQPGISECTICLLPLCDGGRCAVLTRRGVRTCRHFFHLSCALPLPHDKGCPLCRSPFDGVSALPLPWEDPTRWFRCVDLSQDRRLSRQEVVDALVSQFPLALSPLEAALEDELWAKWDTNRDGFIEEGELVGVLDFCRRIAHEVTMRRYREGANECRGQLGSCLPCDKPSSPQRPPIATPQPQYPPFVAPPVEEIIRAAEAIQVSTLTGTVRVRLGSLRSTRSRRGRQDGREDASVVRFADRRAGERGWHRTTIALCSFGHALSRVATRGRDRRPGEVPPAM